jgi:hypothetical protein
MPCDHDATRASLDAFTAATTIIGVQGDGEGGWLLLGNCAGCRTTLAIEIGLARGRVVHGEFEARPCADGDDSRIT